MVTHANRTIMCTFSVESTEQSNLWEAHYYMAFKLDGWEVISYVIIPFLMDLIS